MWTSHLRSSMGISLNSPKISWRQYSKTERKTESRWSLSSAPRVPASQRFSTSSSGAISESAPVDAPRELTGPTSSSPTPNSGTARASSWSTLRASSRCWTRRRRRASSGGSSNPSLSCSPCASLTLWSSTQRETSTSLQSECWAQASEDEMLFLSKIWPYRKEC